MDWYEILFLYDYVCLHYVGSPKTNKYFYHRLVLAIALILGLPVAYIVTHLEAAPYTGTNYHSNIK